MNAPQDFRQMTVDSIGKDLLQALLLEIKLLPDVWQKLTQKKQDDIIERLRNRVSDNVKMAVHTLASAGRTTIAADLESFTSKDGVKVVFKVSPHAAGIVDLMQATGKACLLVVANPEDHTDGMDDIQGEPDQRAMDLGHEYHDNDGGGMDDGDVVDAEFVVDAPALPAPGNTTATEEEIEAQFDAGWSAAEAGKPESDCPVMNGELCIAWVKGWKAWHEQERDPNGNLSGSDLE